MDSRGITFVLFYFISVGFVISGTPPTTPASPSFPALFAFGDSTVDSGNNNRLSMLMSGDHRPYGRDFEGHKSTGRFSNGKLATDFLVSSLGIKNLLPAYLDPKLTDDDLLTGVSFGSAGTGLDEMTAALSNVMDMDTQLDLFDEALGTIEEKVGREEADKLMEKSLFLISVGTNDFLYNAYILPLRMLEFSLPEYQDFLLQKLKSFIQYLYSRGARKFMVMGLPPMGCLPLQVTGGSLFPGPHMLQRVCVRSQNADARAHNAKLKDLTATLHAQLHGSRLVYAQVYDTMMDMINNPANYGFEVTAEACCGTGLVEAGPLCGAFSATCEDASKYIFWDSVHLTEVAYSFIGNTSLHSDLLSKLLD